MAHEKKRPSLAEVSVMSKGMAEADGPESSEDSGEYSAVADELFDALESGDRAAFATALKAAIHCCK